MSKHHRHQRNKPAVKHKEQPLLLDCPQCHSFISEDQINTKNKVAKCAHCDHVFSYEEEGYWDPFGLPTSTQPDGIEMLKLPSFLEFLIRPSKAIFNNLFLIFFTFAWNAIIGIFIYNVLTSGAWTNLPFVAIHFAFGLVLLWNILGQIFNRSRIYIDENELCVSTKPFKLGQREKCVPVSDINELTVKLKPSKGKNGQVTSSYQLLANTYDRKKISLIEGLDRNTMKYLEKEIEAYLGIENR